MMASSSIMATRALARGIKIGSAATPQRGLSFWKSLTRFVNVIDSSETNRLIDGKITNSMADACFLALGLRNPLLRKHNFSIFDFANGARKVIPIVLGEIYQPKSDSEAPAQSEPSTDSESPILKSGLSEYAQEFIQPWRTKGATSFEVISMDVTAVMALEQENEDGVLVAMSVNHSVSKSEEKGNSVSEYLRTCWQFYSPLPHLDWRIVEIGDNSNGLLASYIQGQALRQA